MKFQPGHFSCRLLFVPYDDALNIAMTDLVRNKDLRLFVGRPKPGMHRPTAVSTTPFYDVGEQCVEGRNTAAYVASLFRRGVRGQNIVPACHRWRASISKTTQSGNSLSFSRALLKYHAFGY